MTSETLTCRDDAGGSAIRVPIGSRPPLGKIEQQEDRPMMTPAEALERAAVLAPRLAERAMICETLRRCPDPTIDDLYETGLMQIMQPRRYGGAELNIDTVTEVAKLLAGGCASSSWVWMNLATHSWNIGQFGEEAQDDVWGRDPRALAATGLAFPCGKARRVEGGFQLTGRWPFGSGVDAARWMIVGAQVEGTDAPAERRVFLVPKPDYRSLDNWHAFGLSGTGSHDVEITDAFVPDHRSVRPELLASGRDAPGASISDSPVYRLPAFSAFGFALASVPLGAARAAVDQFTTGIRKRASTFNAARLAEQVPVQLRVAEASARVAFAETAYRTAIQELVALTEGGKTIGHDVKLRWKRDLAFAVTLCKHAVESLLVASGGGGLSTTSALQRHFRDVLAASSHIALTWDVQASLYGRHALGIPLDADLLI
jgi:3-hydroxy-9,10-secoandrosta-1,3,5(10)-triene-9,17-dione monooxygenase